MRVRQRWESDVNRTLERLAENWPEARVADWHATSGDASLLYADLTHPNPRGQKAMARIVRRALGD